MEKVLRPKAAPDGAEADGAAAAPRSGRAGPGALPQSLPGGRPKAFVPFETLTEGVLVRRYKRFLADVEIPGQGLVTAHTPNTGRMTGCSEPGRPVYLSFHGGKGRRHPWSWRMIRMDCGLVGVDTSLPNRLVKLALIAGRVRGFPAGGSADSEVRSGASRLDLRWVPPGRSGPECLIEVKNCTWVEGGRALFPDAASARASKHLAELEGIARRGMPAALVVVVQRPDGKSFSPADEVDPAWGRALRGAVSAGVRVMAYEAKLELSGAAFGGELPLDLQP